MNIVDGFNNFKNSLLREVYNDEHISPVSYIKKTDLEKTSHLGKIKWILEKNIEKSKNYEELEKNIQSAVKEIKELSAKRIFDIPEAVDIKNIALKIQEQVTAQIQAFQKEFGNVPEISESQAEFCYDRPLQHLSMKKIEPVASVESKRYERIRHAIREMYFYSLALAEYHESKTTKDKENWSLLLDHIHEKTFKDYSYEVRYLDIKTGKILRTDVVEHHNINSYQFHIFEDRDNNTILPLTVYQPKAKGGKTPVALYMHAGPAAVAWPGQENPQFCALAQLGYTIIAPNYRGSSLRDEYEALLEGNVDQFPFEDVQATLNYIRTREDLEPLPVLTGISYGTYLNSIILDRLSDQLKGVFLHTGFFGNSSPSPFDHMKNIRPDLPIFLASGVKDFGNTGIEWVIKYLRVLQDVSNNFSASLLEEGGHQLISLIRSDIAQFNLENIKKDLESNKADLNAIMKHTSERYNSEEFMRYVSQLVEFFDQLTLGEISKPTEKITREKAPRGSELMNKIKVDRDIKAREATAIPLCIDQSLHGAPYTPSLAQLANIGHEDSSVELVVQKFLEHYDSVKSSISEEFFKEFNIDKEFWEKALKTRFAEDKKLHSLICSIINKEIEYKGSYALYHGASAAAGFVYDVYTHLRCLVLIQANKQDPQHVVSRLRALDDAFLKIRSAEDLINKMKLEEIKDDTTLLNYLPGYQEVGLSAQWFLFGSYKYWFNSTFFRYFLGGASATNVSIEKILRDFFQAVGITDENDLNKMIRQYSEVYKEYIDQKDGRLMQIFVSPEIIDEVAYVAETGGYPLELEMDDGSPSTHSPSKIISKAMQNPQAFEAILKKNRANFKRQGLASREEFTKEKTGLAYINSVEGRFFMDPKYMDDPQKIQMVNYHSHAPKEGYEKALEKIAEQSLASWLDAKPKLGPAMTYHKPPIVTLQDYVHKEVAAAEKRKTYSLYDLLSAGKWEEAEKWINHHPGDITSSLDPQGRPLLYQLLRDNKFEAAKKFLDISKSHMKLSKLINAKDSKGYPMIYDLLFEGKFDAAAFLIEQHPNLKLTAHKHSMIIELLGHDKFDAAKFLTGANISEYTHDRELIKLILLGNLKEAEKRAQRLVGATEKPVEPKKNDSSLTLNDRLRNDLKQEELAEVKQLIGNEYDLEKLKDLYAKALKEGNLEAAKELRDSGLTLSRQTKEQLISDILLKESWTSEDQKQAEFIYQQGVSINELLADGQSILFSLVKSKQWNKIKWLQERGLNINLAMTADHVPLLISLIRQNQHTPNKLKEYLPELIALGIEVNSYVRNKLNKDFVSTAISEAFEFNFDDEIIQQLLDKGANVNLKVSTLENPFYNFLISADLKNENSQTIALRMIKFGADVNGKMADGRFLIDGVIKDSDAVKFLLGTDKIILSPSMSFEAREKILLHLIETEQWEKIQGLASNQDKALHLLELPDRICQSILQKSIESKWPLEKTARILNKLFEFGASPYEENILSFIDKNMNKEDRFKLAKLFVKRGAILENHQEYSIDFIKWFSSRKSQNKLSDRQFQSLKSVLKNQIRNGHLDSSDIAELLCGRDFVFEALLDGVKSSRINLAECPANLREKVLLAAIADGTFTSVGKQFFPGLNISDTLANSLRKGDFINAKQEMEQIVSKRVDANTKLWNLFTSNSPEWKIEGEKILKLNPARDVFSNEEFKKTLLYEMVCTNKLDRAQWLIENGANTEALQRPFSDDRRELPLLYCVFVTSAFISWEDRRKALDFLIDNGANIDILMKDKQGSEEPILSIALNSSDETNAKYLISKGANVNIVYGNQGYPILLHKLLSTKSEYLESLCGLLIENGAKVNARTPDGHLLLTTLLKEENIDAAQFLMGKGGKIDSKDLQLKTKSGITIEQLIKANDIRVNNANQQFYEIFISDSVNWKEQAERVLKFNPFIDLSINKENGTDAKLLFQMVFDGKLDRAQWLIDHGANVNAFQSFFKKQEELPILLTAIWSSFIAKKEDRLKYLDFLINNGANVDMLVTENGLQESLLSKLLEPVDTTDAKYLISKGANVNLVYGDTGYPLLLHQLLSKKSQYLESHCGLLIENGANVNARTSDGHLLLATLLKEEKIDAAKFLIAKGGKIDPDDLELKTSSGMTIKQYLDANKMSPNFWKAAAI